MQSTSKYLTKDSPIIDLPSVGPSTVAKLKKLEINTVLDLLYHVPFRYKDTSQFVSVEQLIREGEGTICVTCETISSTRVRQYFITKAKVFDKSGKLYITWFNQPYVANNFKVGHKYLISGKYSTKKSFKSMTSPQFEEYNSAQQESKQIHLGRITPFYDATLKLSTKWLRTKLFFLRDKIKDIVIEPLPLFVIEKYNLLSLEKAVELIHFPESDKDIRSAQQRLGFDEMLRIGLLVEQQRKDYLKFLAPKLELPKELYDKFLSKLAFALTKDQEQSISEILKDLDKSVPMRRLLNGDVGSGKTIVAMFGAFVAICNGYSGLVMAPTTILAQQHFTSFSNLLSKLGVRVVMHTAGSKLTKDDLITPTVFVTTHSILYEANLPSNIGIVIIDEQHRFGVEQRQLLAKLDVLLNDKGKKKAIPHYLSMTATPIPRTLTNVLYGDTEVSIINTMPKNRIPIKSFYVPNAKREACYQWVKEKIVQTKGREQAFFIFPLVEESEKIEAKSATVEYEKLSQGVFRSLKVGLLHGQMKTAEKEGVLQKFKNKEYNILVATSVVEVGIDIADATIMIIENAERFGLAQLHQFRGRVGRGNIQSYCYVLSGENIESDPQQSIERLKYFVEHPSGFDVAEFDLQSRGPGEVYGKIQSGIPNLKVANILDLEMIKKARETGKELIEKYSEAELDQIKQNLFK